MTNHLRVPIINPAAVTRYLARPLDNWDFIKQASKAELMEEAHRDGMRFATDPWDNQLACFHLGVNNHKFYYLLKQGGGKTKIIADLIRYRKRKGHLVGALISVPELLHVTGWEYELRNHAPDLTFRLLVGDKGEREALMRKPADVCVINNAGLGVYMTKLVQGRKDKRKRVIDPAVAAEFIRNFNFGAIDEIHRIVNDTSGLYSFFTWLSANADFMYGLSGTPHGRDPTPLFHQMRLTDGGETLGTSLPVFQKAFFTPKYDHWNGVKHIFDEQKAPEINRIIKHRSITYETEEMHDLPRKVPVRIPVKLRGESALYYDRIMRGVAEARGDYASLQNIFVRQRQCASGYISMKADDDSRIEVQFKENPKLESLIAFLLGKPNEKILVYHEYRVSARLIEEQFVKNKIPFAAIRGGVKDPAEEYKRFLEDKRCRIFLLNNKIGSENINPQYVCRRLIFYEGPTDAKARDQAIRRVYRKGQQYPSFIHDMVVMGTIEEKVLRYAKEGMNVMDAVMSGEVKLDEVTT